MQRSSMECDQSAAGVNRPDKRLFVARPRAGWTLHASIQSAVEGVTRALAVELARIRVNAVSPGLARTPRWNAWTDAARRELYRNEEHRLPVGRVGEASEIATAYLYLMEYSYATGTSSWQTAAALSFKPLAVSVRREEGEAVIVAALREDRSALHAVSMGGAPPRT